MIPVEYVTKIYGDQRAVDDLTFDVHSGWLVGLVTGSVSSIIAPGRFGRSLLTRARRAPPRKTLR